MLEMKNERDKILDDMALSALKNTSELEKISDETLLIL
jgi:hypothetical protein